MADDRVTMAPLGLEALPHRHYLPMFMFTHRYAAASRLLSGMPAPQPAPTPASAASEADDGLLATVIVPLLTPETAPAVAERAHHSYLPLFLRVHKAQTGRAP